MSIAEERDLPRPLASEEIREGLLYIITEAIKDRMSKTCNLYGCSYPKFRANIVIDLFLDDFETEIPDHMEIAAGGLEEGGEHIGIDIEVPHMPPNQFRMETEQPVVVSRLEDGKRVERRIKYQKRTARKAVKE